VYLWATTPVLISVLTFVTFVLLGNTLTAAKARSLFIPAVLRIRDILLRIPACY
jgi:hypothetical protein